MRRSLFQLDAIIQIQIHGRNNIQAGDLIAQYTLLLLNAVPGACLGHGGMTPKLQMYPPRSAACFPI